MASHVTRRNFLTKTGLLLTGIVVSNKLPGSPEDDIKKKMKENFLNI